MKPRVLRRCAAATAFWIRPEADFDEIVQLAASIYKAPIAAITFIDQDRQWVKAAIGQCTPVRPTAPTGCVPVPFRAQIPW